MDGKRNMTYKYGTNCFIIIRHYKLTQIERLPSDSKTLPGETRSKTLVGILKSHVYLDPINFLCSVEQVSIIFDLNLRYYIKAFEHYFIVWHILQEFAIIIL